MPKNNLTRLNNLVRRHVLKSTTDTNKKICSDMVFGLIGSKYNNMQEIYDYFGRKDTWPATQLKLYPERDPSQHIHKPINKSNGLFKFSIKLQKDSLSCDRFVKCVNKKGLRIAGLPKSKLICRLLALRKTLRRFGLTLEPTSEAFALIRELSLSCLGRRHYDSQIMAGWVMLNGRVAEMQTGEGKTLAISLAAATAALAGTPTHVLTANDYLVVRDATTHRPLFQALGLSVGMVTENMGPNERRTAYACDITYCTAKELAFDYLRDGMVFNRGTSEPIRRLDRLYGSRSRSAHLLLRGLHFAIIDECDSILIDEANSPIVLSGPVRSGSDDGAYLNAMRIAKSLEGEDHFTLSKREKRIELTDIGRNTIKKQFEHSQLGQSNASGSEALIRTALAALYLFDKDQHYLVRDNSVHIIDENTGRIRSNNSWERGLQQMIEAKEGCKISAEHRVLSRISFPRLFRRYLQFSGTTGTAFQAKNELREVYKLGIVRIPTHRSSSRMHLKEMTYATNVAKLDAIVASVVSIHKTGRPILLATRTIESSEKLSRLLERKGLKHQLLSAKQDEQEANVVACAGRWGGITIATNMAGRGTDIVLDGEVLNLGGLHVIATERHEANRIDQQLYGRCARQGDLGSCQLFTSSEDKLIELYGSSWLMHLANHRLSERLNCSDSLNKLVSQYAQWCSQRHNAQIRRNLLLLEDNMHKSMGFTGPSE